MGFTELYCEEKPQLKVISHVESIAVRAAISETPCDILQILSNDRNSSSGSIPLKGDLRRTSLVGISSKTLNITSSLRMIVPLASLPDNNVQIPADRSSVACAVG